MDGATGRLSGMRAIHFPSAIRYHISMPADAVQASQRRTLHFDSIDQIMADVDQLAGAQKQGKLRSLGNWTAGQNLGHLASWIDFGSTAFRSKFRSSPVL